MYSASCRLMKQILSWGQVGGGMQGRASVGAGESSAGKEESVRRLLDTAGSRLRVLE